MGLFREFRDFASKGNVIDLAVGVIIGAAFGKIVSSLVDDVIMPPIGTILGKVDFANLFVVLPGQEDKIAKLKEPLASVAQAKTAGIATLNYGLFLNNVVQFLIVAFAIFLLVRSVNKLKAFAEKPVESGEPTTKECPYCLSTVPIKATRCAHCTSDLQLAA